MFWVILYSFGWNERWEDIEQFSHTFLRTWNQFKCWWRLSLCDWNNYTSLQVHTCYYCRARNSCLASVTPFSLQVPRWKDHLRVEFTFTRGFGHVSEAAFTICGNPTKVFSTDISPHDNFPFYLASMTSIIFVNLSRLILKKGGFIPVLANHKKGIFLFKKAFLGEIQRPERQLSNQISSFRLETR